MSQIEYIQTAFRELLTACWPSTAALAALNRGTDDENLTRHMATVFEHVRQDFPRVHLWWKNEDSHFLGACSQIVAAAAIPRSVFLSGINDLDERLPWARQGAHYIRDDRIPTSGLSRTREVFQSQTAKLDILERQSRVDGDWVWLRTSKVPCPRSSDGDGGTVGGFETISDDTAKTLRKERQN